MVEVLLGILYGYPSCGPAVPKDIDGILASFNGETLSLYVLFFAALLAEYVGLPQGALTFIIPA